VVVVTFWHNFPQPSPVIARNAGNVCQSFSFHKFTALLTAHEGLSRALLVPPSWQSISGQRNEPAHMMAFPSTSPRGSETTYTPTALDSHAHYMAESQKENRDIQCTVGLWGPALRTGQRCNCTWPENGWAQLVGYIKKYNELGCSVVLSGKEKNQYI